MLEFRSRPNVLQVFAKESIGPLNLLFETQVRAFYLEGCNE